MTTAISYNIGSLHAELRLTAVSASGLVLREGLRWQLIPVQVTARAEKEYVSEEAQPLFQVPQGNYAVLVTHGDREIKVEDIHLERNARTDLVILIDLGERDKETNYYPDEVEFDGLSEYERRSQDREDQRVYALSEGEIKDPYRQKNDSGNAIPAHPLLAEAAQFDGVGPENTPLPDQNPDSEKNLELQYANQLQNNLTNSSAPTSAPTLSR